MCPRSFPGPVFGVVQLGNRISIPTLSSWHRSGCHLLNHVPYGIFGVRSHTFKMACEEGRVGVRGKFKAKFFWVQGEAMYSPFTTCLCTCMRVRLFEICNRKFDFVLISSHQGQWRRAKGVIGKTVVSHAYLLNNCLSKGGWEDTRSSAYWGFLISVWLLSRMSSQSCLSLSLCSLFSALQSSCSNFWDLRSNARTMCGVLTNRTLAWEHGNFRFGFWQRKCWSLQCSRHSMEDRMQFSLLRFSLWTWCCSYTRSHSSTGWPSLLRLWVPLQTFWWYLPITQNADSYM